MPPITIQLVLAHHGGMNSPYNFQLTRPQQLHDLIDADTFARTMSEFNRVYNLTGLRMFWTRVASLGFTICLAGVVLVTLGSHINDGLVQMILGIVGLIVGAATGIASQVYHNKMKMKMKMELHKLIQKENMYYRDEYSRNRATPLSVVWAESTRRVLIHRNDRRMIYKEELIIVCTVNEHRPPVAAVAGVAVPAVEGVNAFIVPAATPIVSAVEGNRPEGDAPASIAIDVHEEVASSAPVAAVPQEQYHLQQQILNGER